MRCPDDSFELVPTWRRDEGSRDGTPVSGPKFPSRLGRDETGPTSTKEQLVP